jgi:CxxC motif-containing protein (DUF1111 family)
MNVQRSLKPACAAVARTLCALAAVAALATLSLGAADHRAPATTSGGLGASEPDAFVRPLSDLTEAQRALFELGRAEFGQRWVVPFHIGGEWGRGPLSNAEACTDCHAGTGRGRAPERAGMPMQSWLVRLSIPGTDPHGGPLPHPVYGLQLQAIGVLGKVPEEGYAHVDYDERAVRLSEGETVWLRKPRLQVGSLRYGPLEQATLTSARVAPPVFGLGLLESVPEAVVLELAAGQREAGFEGRPNYVRDLEQDRSVLGRFGHKANQPSAAQQAATALIEDIGVTSRFFPVENCTQAQRPMCAAVPSVGSPEIPDARFDALVFYLRALAPPPRRDRDDPVVLRGERLFEQARCAVCHVPALKTGTYPPLPQIAGRVIHPYTDLLLHDMGEGLADGRPDYRAGPRDWRTPPLWGIGLAGKINGNATYLHDGRARSLSEAILWHGGEARVSRDAFVAMQRQEREALLAFLRSL